MISDFVLHPRIPRADTFIEKDSSINEEIERLRLSAMSTPLAHFFPLLKTTQPRFMAGLLEIEFLDTPWHLR